MAAKLTFFNAVTERLSVVEKDRLVCAYLNTTDGQVNWPKAALEFGSASEESMKKCVYNTMKKLGNAAEDIEKAGGLELAAAGSVKKAPSTPRKRKTPAPDGGNEKVKTPRKKGKSAVKVDDAEVEVGAVRSSLGLETAMDDMI